MKEVTFRISFEDSEAERLANYADRTGVKRIFLVRKAIIEYLDRMEKE